MNVNSKKTVYCRSEFNSFVFHRTHSRAPSGASHHSVSSTTDTVSTLENGQVNSNCTNICIWVTTLIKFIVKLLMSTTVNFCINVLQIYL